MQYGWSVENGRLAGSNMNKESNPKGSRRGQRQAIESLQGQDRAAPVHDRMLEAALRGDATDVEKAIADGASVNVK